MLNLNSPLKRLVTCFSITLIVGCSLGNPYLQRLSISSTEPDTEIWVNGQSIGKTPALVDVARDRNVSILARKEGFETGTRSIGTHFSEEGKLDILGTILFALPVVGLLSPGAWTLDETDIIIPMLPGKKPS